MTRTPAAAVIIKPAPRPKRTTVRTDRIAALETTIDLLTDRLEQLEFTIAQALLDEKDGLSTLRGAQAHRPDPVEAALDRLTAALERAQTGTSFTRHEASGLDEVLGAIARANRSNGLRLHTPSTPPVPAQAPEARPARFLRSRPAA